ncbi:LysM peptidoglycan-binding domain-containing protein [Rhodopseudomonas boonkerdii]|uniref:peptidoglycan DD-metalloendopeptidase family protein n=1 Tax=Rhodopseudomonas boonkerdii TaxID=475937 RepID=UPI001E2FBD30|nr:peptidoglycan DD-metalloendopeptidase family protein [Rhodopseudomonas boonkerdii]UGV26844.1 LysM peptidoglycan-binding domain-containing protein [Rhodopseudomonas boonkerdii]
MSRVVELLCSRRSPQVAVLALMSIGFAGCSADMSTRLSQTFDSNQISQNSNRQFGWQGGEATGSVPPRPVAQAPRELPQYQRPAYNPQPQYSSQPLPPPISAPQSYPSAPRPVASAAPMSGGGNGMYTPPPARAPIEHTGSTAPRSVAAAPASNGTTIIVGTSDTLEGLSKRYNVSQAAILQANGYRGPRALSPGQSLIIPRQGTVAVPAVAAAVPAKPAAASTTHYVNRGDTLMSISRRNNIPVAELARANGLSPTAQLKLGSKITIPAARTAVTAAPAAPASAPAPLGAPSTIAAAPVVTAPARVAVAEPQQKARLASATTTPEEAAPETPAKAAEATGALPTFRWPVRGRVAAGYGAKTNGKSNDGINIAVPEGTPVKAAEDGVVAYAGNELKGYGNLVLVRHSNGYVTAYAHASELMVKRGETIKRGQVIMKSGQSGEVSSPQLHFEIRKGSSPVDPLQFLNGA